MKKLKALFCVLFRHSRIQEFCLGYYTCGRCGQQLGDSLGNVYPQAANVVVVGCNCKICRANYKKLTWIDKFLVPNPLNRIGARIVKIQDAMK